MTSAEDPILKALAETARHRAEQERRLLDDRWDLLAMGDLSAEEVAELRELAEQSPEGAEAFAAFAPLGGDFAARTAAAIRAERDVAKSPAANEVVAVLPFERKPQATPRHRRPWLGALAAAAAVAAVVAVGPILRRGTDGPLPDYDVELSGGNSEVRGETAPSAMTEKPLVLTQGAPFELIVRPETPTSEPLVLRCYLVPESGGAARPFSACDKAERSPQGSFRVSGVVGEEIRLDDGTWALWTVVGRAGTLPPALSPTTRGTTSGDGWTSRRAPRLLRIQSSSEGM